MKKKGIFLLAIVMVMLTGCSRVDDYLDSKIKDASGITENSEYQAFERYTQEGKLDDEGYYLEEAFESEDVKDAISKEMVKVSFAQNSYLNINYYNDAAMSREISEDTTELAIGSSIYATISLDDSIPSSAYSFSGFRMSEVNEDGDRIQLNTLVPQEDGLLFNVTSEYRGKDLIFEPYGEYSNKVVTLKSKYVDQDEQEHDLVGTWNINDKPISGNSAEISPISSYIISYDFDGNEYFYLSSEPECFYKNNDDGIVIFNKRESTDETLDYEVKLHEYLSVKITSNQLRYVSINNGEEHKIEAGAELEIPKLKYGDNVSIVTDVEWNDLENCKDLVWLSTEKLNKSGQNAYVYEMSVPEKGAEFHFDPSEYSFEHGEITFSCMGDEVTSPKDLAVGRKIYYEQKKADSGYRLPEGDHVITVSTAEQTKKEIESIHFIEVVKVKVDLPQPKFGGTIEYYANNSRIYSDQFTGDSGTEITMKFDPWEGWINRFNNGEKYRVTNELAQTISIDKQSIDNAFYEDDKHKPELTVVLEKGVDENMRFSFEASGLDAHDYNYESEWYRNDYTVISKHRIGTERGISLAIGNSSIQSGTAIKIKVEKTGEDKSKTKIEKVSDIDYRLVDSLTELQAPLDIYSDSNNGKSKVWYNSIKVTIRLVDVKKFSQPTALANSRVEVRKTETGEILNTGSILEGSEKITLSIKPLDGYYVSGKSVKENLYQTNMKFEKFLSDSEKIIAEHPIEKYIRVVLDNNDPYGTCKYMVDGNEVTGTVNLKIGDKIKLEYKITNPTYEIDGVSGFLGSSIGKNTKETSKTITVDRTYDEKIITRETFDIKIRKEE